MRLFVGFKVFETLVDPADIKRARETFGEKMQVIGPKLEASGIFAGKRQGFMVMDVASEDEAFLLLAELAAATALIGRRCRLPLTDNRQRQRAFGILIRQGYEAELAYDAVRAASAGDVAAS